MDQRALAARKVGNELGGFQGGRHDHEAHVVLSPLLQKSKRMETRTCRSLWTCVSAASAAAAGAAATPVGLWCMMPSMRVRT